MNKKERLRMIRLIRAAQQQEVERSHTWMKHVASDDDIIALSDLVRVGSDRSVSRANESPDHRDERLAIGDRAQQAQDRFHQWSLQQDQE